MQYEPVGVAGIISPWNFPMNVMCRKTLPALLTGNAVVFKPATFTPWSGIFMATLLEKAGLPPGVFNCVTGAGSSIGSALVTDPRVRAISFTGSTSVGKQIQQQAAANLTRTQLELGGKNALIVMEDADLAQAVDAAITAGFSNAGQWCTSTSRVLLHRPIVRPFLQMLVARCEKMTVGDGLSETTDMGPVAGPSQYQDIRAAITEAESEGARMVAGDDSEPRALSPESAGYFIRPTVFTYVTPDMAIFREEIFGPVLAVCEFGSVDEAIALGNRSCTGCLPPSTRATLARPSRTSRHRGRSRARQHPHRLQRAGHAVWRRQAVWRRPAREQRDRTGIFRRPESRLRARLRPQPSVVLFRHEHVSAFFAADVRHERLGRLSDDTCPSVAAFRTRWWSEILLHDAGMIKGKFCSDWALGQKAIGRLTMSQD